MAILTWRELSVMMQKRVISEAVPAVVLMLISGSMGLVLTSTPCGGGVASASHAQASGGVASHIQTCAVAAWPWWAASRC